MKSERKLRLSGRFEPKKVLEQDDQDGTEHSLSQNSEDYLAWPGRSKGRVHVLQRSYGDPGSHAEAYEQHVRMRLEEKDALQGDMCAGDVGGFEGQDDQKSVYDRKQELNFLSLMREHELATAITCYRVKRSRDRP